MYFRQWLFQIEQQHTVCNFEMEILNLLNCSVLAKNNPSVFLHPSLYLSAVHPLLLRFLPLFFSSIPVSLIPSLSSCFLSLILLYLNIIYVIATEFFTTATVP